MTAQIIVLAYVCHVLRYTRMKKHSEPFNKRRVGKMRRQEKRFKHEQRRLP